MPRRTRACAICRQKRIKCDATMPHCLMCKRFNRECPGPMDAPLTFVDNSSYPSGKKPRAKKPTPESNSLEVAQRIDDGRDIAVGVGDLPDEMAYVLNVGVSPQYVLSEAYFSNFVAFFCAEGRHLPGPVRRTPNWLYELPRMAATPLPTSPNNASALSLALRATTAAFSSMQMKNNVLLHHAYRLYGGSLQLQRRVLQGRGDKLDNGSVVATSIMLSLFESVVATTGEGFALHNIGAAKMIDNALNQAAQFREHKREIGHGDNGPTPMIVNIFFHTRIQLCFVYLTTSDSRIRNDPVMRRALLEACGWSQEALPLNMQIIAPFARLMELQAQASEVWEMSPVEREERRASFVKAKEEVDRLWNGYEWQIKGLRLCWVSPETGHTDFNDPFTALTYAYFSACWILLDVLAPTYAALAVQPMTQIAFRPSTSSQSSDSGSVSPLSTNFNPSLPLAGTTTPNAHPTSATNNSASSSPHNPSFPPPASTNHFALILSVSRYIRLRDTGFAYLRLHSPLFLVAMYAPTWEQRAHARMVFEDWEVGSLKGIGRLAIAKLDQEGR